MESDMPYVYFNGYHIDMHDDDDLEESIEYLRDRFERDIQPQVVEQYGADDVIALNEAFNNWTDMLCKDGEISETVYSNATRTDD